MGLLDWLGQSNANALRIQAISAVNACVRLQSGDLAIVDVRTPAEWSATGIPDGAKGLSLGADGFVESLLSLYESRPQKGLALICKSGMRAEKAAKIAQSHGLIEIKIVAGGIDAWRKAKLPLASHKDA